MQTELLIGGRRTGGEGPPESVLDAGSGAQIATVASASVEQVGAAVAAAEGDFLGRSGTGPRGRGAHGPGGGGAVLFEDCRGSRTRSRGLRESGVAQYRQAARGDAQ